jgi:hypothetical protein
MRLSFCNCFTNANSKGNFTYSHHFHDLGLALIFLSSFEEKLNNHVKKVGFCFNWIHNEYVWWSFQKNVHVFKYGVWLMEIGLKCSSYLFAFSLRLLIRLNINYGFEYKKGYLSFGLKVLSCGFSITYFDKINGEMFCEKFKFYRQIVHKYSPSSLNCYNF